MVTAMHHTSLTVRDLEQSIAFYSALGLEVVMRQESEARYLKEITGFPDAHIKMAHLSVPNGGHRLELFEYVQPRGQPIRSRTCDPGSTHLALIVGDLPGLYEELLRRGVAVVSQPVTIDSGANAGGRVLYVRDPDDFTIELFQPPAQR
jgi:lactoylglutathione lyase